MTTIPEFCCPQCNRSLQLHGNAYRCLPCAKTFPIVFGIPDFRLFVGPYASDQHIYKEDDSHQAMSLVECFDQYFGEMLRRYLLAENVSGHRFTRLYHNALTRTERGVDNLKEIERLSHSRHPHEFASVLEVGCGTGCFLVAARRRVNRVIGIDMAMRSLVTAKKRLAELKLDDLPLVCCYAEYLPFKDSSFDLVIAEDVLEHVQQQDRMLRESCRVMNANGVLHLKIPNRFSLTPEPHAYVWGVGMLPRSLMSPYVEWLTGSPYRVAGHPVHLTSFFE